MFEDKLRDIKESNKGEERMEINQRKRTEKIEREQSKKFQAPLGPVLLPSPAPCAPTLKSANLPPQEPSNWIRTLTLHGEGVAANAADSAAHCECLAAARQSRSRALASSGNDVSTHVFDDDHANLVCTESAFLLIHSDHPRNLASSSYNLKIPPSTYSEAKCQPDFEV